MIFLKTDSGDSRLYRLLVLVGLPILIAMGVEVKFHEKGWDLLIDFEVLQYLFAAILAAIGGFFGIVVIVIASIFKSIHYDGVFTGFSILHRGSIVAGAALISIAHLFSQKTRLQMLFTANSVAIPGALLLIALCAVEIDTHTVAGVGVGLTSWAHVYLQLNAFYYGLSSIQLIPGIAIVLLIGSLADLLCACDGKLCYGYDIMLNQFPNYSPEGILGQLLPIFRGRVGPVTFVQALILVYVAFLGRGLRNRWLSEGHKGSIDRIANNLTSLLGLISAAILSILIWEFSISLSFGWLFSFPEGPEQYFRQAFYLINGSVAFIMPFVGFCIGALYGARGVWLATLCFMILVLALPVGIALKIGDTSFDGTYMFVADTIKLYYRFLGLDVGRGLALPLYAILGMIVTKRTAFYTPPAE